MSRDIINRHCLGLMKIFALDSFVEHKVRELHTANGIRFAGIIEVYRKDGMHKGEVENGVPEGRGVYIYFNGDILSRCHKI